MNLMSKPPRPIKSPVRSASLQLIDPEPWLYDFRRCDPSVRHQWAEHWLSRTADKLEHMWPRVYELLDAVREHETWKNAGDASFELYVERLLGKPFAVFEELEQTYHFARFARPELFEQPLTEAIEDMRLADSIKRADERPDLLVVDDDDDPRGRVERARRGGLAKAGKLLSDDHHKATHGSTDRTYLARRLKRDHPDIYEDLKAGKYRSVRAAAKAAGIVKEPSPVKQLERWWDKATDAEKMTFLQTVVRVGLAQCPICGTCLR